MIHLTWKRKYKKRIMLNSTEHECRINTTSECEQQEILYYYFQYFSRFMGSLKLKLYSVEHEIKFHYHWTLLVEYTFQSISIRRVYLQIVGCWFFFLLFNSI